MLLTAVCLVPWLLGAGKGDKKKSADDTPQGRVEVTETPAEDLVFIVAIDGATEEVLKVDYDARFARVRVLCPKGDPALPASCSETVLRRIGFPPKVEDPKGTCEGGLSLVAVVMNGRPVTETVPQHKVKPKRDLRWYVAGSTMEAGGTVTASYGCVLSDEAAPDAETQPQQSPPTP